MLEFKATLILGEHTMYYAAARGSGSLASTLQWPDTGSLASRRQQIASPHEGFCEGYDVMIVVSVRANEFVKREDADS